MKVSDYDFKYRGVMKNAMQSLPIGNGDLGANIWADKSGLFILLSKTDAWSEVHRLLKTGFLKLTLTPNPFNGKTEWRLSYNDGILYIKAKDAEFRIYADAFSPVYHISYTSNIPRKAELQIINYRDKELHISSDDHSNYHFMSEHPAKNKSLFSFLKKRQSEDASPDNPFGYNCVESGDVVYSRNAHSLGQYHHNDTSCYEFTLEHQGLGGFKEKNDPILNRTFGFLAFCAELMSDGNCLKGENLKEFEISAVSHTDFCENAEVWIDKAYELSENIKTDISSHKKYWSDMWERSYVEIKGVSDVWHRITESCIAQRYLNLCAGRGACPIKFNGSIFTCQPSPHYKNQDNYDYRRWGGPYWFQNTRLVYWGMLLHGDYDLMKPFFELYTRNLPLAKYRTKTYFGHDGAFFSETMTLFATYSNKDYGADRDGKKASDIPNPYIRHYYVGALELCKMMLCYVEHTEDTEFLKNDLLPFAKEILEFYRYHFSVKNGKLRFYPSASLETWHDCADDTPTIVGLSTVAGEILKCAEASEELKSLCSDVISLLPPVPYREKDGKKVIAPFTANMDKVRRNVENPELYTVFPFGSYGLGKDELSVARDTFLLRDIKESGGWQQHGIQAALLGLSDEAFKELLYDSRNKN